MEEARLEASWRGGTCAPPLVRTVVTRAPSRTADAAGSKACVTTTMLRNRTRWYHDQPWRTNDQAARRPARRRGPGAPLPPNLARVLALVDGRTRRLASRDTAACALLRIVSPPLVPNHVASLATHILARRPALFEEAAAFTLATKLPAVLDIFRHLLPLVFVPAGCLQIGFSLLRLPDSSGVANALVSHRLLTRPPTVLHSPARV